RRTLPPCLSSARCVAQALAYHIASSRGCRRRVVGNSVHFSSGQGNDLARFHHVHLGRSQAHPGIGPKTNAKPGAAIALSERENLGVAQAKHRRISRRNRFFAEPRHGADLSVFSLEGKSS